jgi:hypothetical protein
MDALARWVLDRVLSLDDDVSPVAVVAQHVLSEAAIERTRPTACPASFPAPGGSR